MPSGDGCGVEDLALGGVMGVPPAVRLAQERLPIVVDRYGALADLARRRFVKEGDEEIR